MRLILLSQFTNLTILLLVSTEGKKEVIEKNPYFYFQFKTHICIQLKFIRNKKICSCKQI